MNLELSISFKTSTKMTNLKHNNRELSEKEYLEFAHKHIQRENTKYNIEIVKGNIEEAYEKIFGEALKEYNDKQKRSDRKINNYLKHIRKSKALDVQREFILAVGSIKDFSNEDITKKQEFAEKIIKPMVYDFIKNNPNLYIYNAVIHIDEIGAPHAHINLIPIAKGYKKGLSIQPSFKKALYNQGFTEKGKHQYKQFRDKQIQIFEKHLNNYNLQRKVVGTNNIKDVREYKKIMSEINKEASAYKNAKFQQIDTELEVYKEKMIESTKEEIKRLENTLKRQKNEIEKNDEKISKNNKQILSQKTDLENLNQAINNKISEFDVLRGQISTEKDFLIQSTEEEYKRLIDTLKCEIQVLENKAIEKINNMSCEDENYLIYKKDIEFVKEMTGLTIKQVVMNNIINAEKVKKYELLTKKTKEIFKGFSLFNAQSKIKEVISMLKNIAIPNDFKDLNPKIQDKFFKVKNEIYPKKDVLAEKIEKIKNEQKHSLHDLLKVKAEEKIKTKEKPIKRDYGLER